MKERTLVLIKPDGVQRALIGEIISRIERITLKVVGMKLVYASPELAGQHYLDDETWLNSVGQKAHDAAAKKGETLTQTPRDIGLRIRRQLMDFISMSPIVALCIEGHNAVATIRKLVGDTAPSSAPPGTIRGDYSIDTYQLSDCSGRPIQNLIHASGSVIEAEREITLWFNQDEIHTYMRVDEPLVYRRGGDE